MTSDVRATCEDLTRSRIIASAATRRPPAAALGWKLERGLLAAADVRALGAAMAAELRQLRASAQWVVSPTLRDFFAEYARLRGGARRGGRAGVGCARGGTRTRRGDVRPAGSA